MPDTDKIALIVKLYLSELTSFLERGKFHILFQDL